MSVMTVETEVRDELAEFFDYVLMADRISVQGLKKVLLNPYNSSGVLNKDFECVMKVYGMNHDKPRFMPEDAGLAAMQLAHFMLDQNYFNFASRYKEEMENLPSPKRPRSNFNPYAKEFPKLFAKQALSFLNCLAYNSVENCSEQYMEWLKVIKAELSEAIIREDQDFQKCDWGKVSFFSKSLTA